MTTTDSKTLVIRNGTLIDGSGAPATPNADVVVEGKCDPTLGWVKDYADIAEAFEPIWKQLDHHHLNEINGLENPARENIAKWIWDRLQPALPQLTAIEVAETCNARCIYCGQ